MASNKKPTASSLYQSSLQMQKQIKREPLPADSKLYTSERLTSFRLPRDLTLGGVPIKSPVVRPNLLQNSKKVYTPNLSAVRNKNAYVLTDAIWWEMWWNFSRTYDSLCEFYFAVMWKHRGTQRIQILVDVEGVEVDERIAEERLCLKRHGMPSFHRQVYFHKERAMAQRNVYSAIMQMNRLQHRLYDDQRSHRNELRLILRPNKNT